MEHYEISELLNNCIKICNKKMVGGKLFIKWSIFYQQKYKV